MIIHEIEQRSNAWYDIRLGRFTGSRIGSLLSAKSTAKYQDAIFDVVSEMITQDFDEIKITEDMQHGIDTEPEAAKEYENIFGIETTEVGFVTPDNEFDEWIGISPDRLINGNGGLEIKCPKKKTHLKYIESGKLPSIYVAQVQSSLWITGREWWDFMSYVPKMKPFIIRVYPDLEYHEKLKQEVEAAIEKVKYYYNNYLTYDFLI
jgi:putative phage-type endonuclease